jgi:hypothetical protein
MVFVSNGNLEFFCSHILWSCGIFSRFGIFYQEKSGNPAGNTTVPLPTVHESEFRLKLCQKRNENGHIIISRPHVMSLLIVAI